MKHFMFIFCCITFCLKGNSKYLLIILNNDYVAGKHTFEEKTVDQDGKTFLKFIVVQIADEYQAGSSNAWRVTIYNGTAQDNTQLCFTNFLREKADWKSKGDEWERGKYHEWEEEYLLKECYHYPLNTKNLPNFLTLRFTVADYATFNDELKLSAVQVRFEGQHPTIYQRMKINAWSDHSNLLVEVPLVQK